VRDHLGVQLAIHADDYGYALAYDRGIVEAGRARAIDGASVMVLREPDPGPLAATEVELGLHLEPDAPPGFQLAEFERLFGAAPAYIDGHHHCHADERLAGTVAALGARLGIPVRAVDSAHRDLLREAGAAFPDALIGRMDEAEPALPAPLAGWLDGLPQPSAVVEWFTHPGHADPRAGSSYDAGREEDLALLLELGSPERWERRGIRRSPLGRSLGA